MPFKQGTDVVQLTLMQHGEWTGSGDKAEENRGKPGD